MIVMSQNPHVRSRRSRLMRAVRTANVAALIASGSDRSMFFDNRTQDVSNLFRSDSDPDGKFSEAGTASPRLTQGRNSQQHISPTAPTAACLQPQYIRTRDADSSANFFAIHSHTHWLIIYM